MKAKFTVPTLAPTVHDCCDEARRPLEHVYSFPAENQFEPVTEKEVYFTTHNFFLVFVTVAV